MVPSYVSLRAKQLLSETFLSTGFSFRDIGLDHLKWDNLYIVWKVEFYKEGGLTLNAYVLFSYYYSFV